MKKELQTKRAAPRKHDPIAALRSSPPVQKNFCCIPLLSIIRGKKLTRSFRFGLLALSLQPSALIFQSPVRNNSHSVRDNSQKFAKVRKSSRYFEPPLPPVRCSAL